MAAGGCCFDNADVGCEEEGAHWHTQLSTDADELDVELCYGAACSGVVRVPSEATVPGGSRCSELLAAGPGPYAEACVRLSARGRVAFSGLVHFEDPATTVRPADGDWFWTRVHGPDGTLLLEKELELDYGDPDAWPCQRGCPPIAHINYE